MINVLHIIEDLHIGGAEQRLVNDLKYLNKDRFSHTVCALRDGIEIDWSDLSTIPVYHFGISSIHAIFRHLPALNRILRAHKINIIHTQLFWADLTGRALKALNSKVKLITTIQSSAHEINNPLYSFKRKMLDGVTGRIFNDGFIAVSDYVKQVSIDSVKFSRDKIRVIYNSVDFDHPVSSDKINALRKEFDISQGEKVLITVGRIDGPKGHIYLVRAMSEIIKKLPHTKLLIVGDGPSRAEIMSEVSRLLLTKHIIFTGRRNDARDLFCLCDVFLFPTLSEGLSLALLEAMAAGKPCIATRIGPNMEVIKHGENGFLINTKNEREIAESVVYLLNQPEIMGRISSNGLLFVRQKFSAMETAGELGRYYEGISVS